MGDLVRPGRQGHKDLFGKPPSLIGGQRLEYELGQKHRLCLRQARQTIRRRDQISTGRRLIDTGPVCHPHQAQLLHRKGPEGRRLFLSSRIKAVGPSSQTRRPLCLDQQYVLPRRHLRSAQAQHKKGLVNGSGV